MELKSNVKTVEMLEDICKNLVERELAEDVTEVVNVEEVPRGFSVKKYQIFVKDPEDVFGNPKRVNVRFWYLRPRKVEGLETDITPDHAIIKITKEGFDAIMQSLTVLELLKGLNFKLNGDAKVNAEEMKKLVETMIKSKETVEIDQEL